LPTEQAKHVRDGRLLPPPAELVIARHDFFARSSNEEPVRNYSSYYIFYLDGHGEEMTDLCEQTLADALAQAEAEFGIKPAEWTIIAEENSEKSPTPK
jgi:hypothetical protein